MNGSFLEDKEDVISFKILPPLIFDLINMISDKDFYLSELLITDVNIVIQIDFLMIFLIKNLNFEK